MITYFLIGKISVKYLLDIIQFTSFKIYYYYFYFPNFQKEEVVMAVITE